MLVLKRNSGTATVDSDSVDLGWGLLSSLLLWHQSDYTLWILRMQETEVSSRVLRVSCWLRCFTGAELVHGQFGLRLCRLKCHVWPHKLKTWIDCGFWWGFLFLGGSLLSRLQCLPLSSQTEVGLCGCSEIWGLPKSPPIESTDRCCYFLATPVGIWWHW